MVIRPSYYIMAAIAFSMVGSVIYFKSIEKQLDDVPGAQNGSGSNKENFDFDAEYQKLVEKQQQVDGQDGKDTTASQVSQAPRKNLDDSYLQRRLDSLPELPRRTVIRGRPIPFEVSIPAGWKMLSWNAPVTAVVNQRSIIHLETGPWTTSLEEFADMTRREMLARFPLMKVVGEETINIDGKTWKHIVLRGQVTGAGEDHEVSLLVYGSRRGSYRFIVEGDRNDLERDALDITLMLTSFRFPADNYEPEDVSEVRVYVNGERVDF